MRTFKIYSGFMALDSTHMLLISNMYLQMV